MSDRNYPGAKWWKFDFHTHTPASNDFAAHSMAEQPELWLQKFMEKGIDCIAITDHNTGAWIDRLKDALENIKREWPEWYRPVCLFPGVEISVHGGVHLLAVFSCDKETSAIDSLLGAVGYTGTRGATDDITQKPLPDVIDCIAKHGGIAIPAHADKEKGLFEVLRGKTLQKVLDNPHMCAVEIVADDYKKPQLYKERKVNWADVRGSDVHDFHSERFGIFTWVKMETPSIEGLKLALIDGRASVNNDMEANPNEHAELVIDSIEVNHAQYMGRGENTLVCELSPFLNTIIGGHGSGKSTLLEFMRLALRRENELPDSLKKERENYFHAKGDGLLTEDSDLNLRYRKGNTRYRLNWATNPGMSSIWVWDVESQDWQNHEGEITSLFPVSIYSQKQIYELAKDPQGLLGIIDEVGEVDFGAYQQIHQDCVHRYKNASLQYNQLWQKTQEESKLKGQLNDLTRQIDQIEKSGHKTVLQNYRRRQQQLHEIEKVEEHWRLLQESIGGSLEDIDAQEIDEELFVEHPQILETLQQKQQQWRQRVNQIQQILAALTTELQQWKNEKAGHGWMQSLNDDLRAYDRLKQQLLQQSIDPNTYSALLQQRSAIAGELNNIHVYREQMKQIKEQLVTIDGEILENRKQLTQRRLVFLAEGLTGNALIGIEVRAFGEAWESVEGAIREILQTGSRFSSDIDHARIVYEAKGYDEVKKYIRNVQNETVQAKDIRFKNHLQNVRNESKTDFELWLPEDSLHVNYKSDGKKFSSGSPGQKSAALLAFILSYGSEPLLLDQPEDDLDNDLVSNLIVEALKTNKQKRQIIVVTHNANIVVNGDSEMVHSLTVAGGQTRIESKSLQSFEMRQQICNTVEGGREAFEQRYKRIHLEWPHA